MRGAIHSVVTMSGTDSVQPFLPSHSASTQDLSNGRKIDILRSGWPHAQDFGNQTAVSHNSPEAAPQAQKHRQMKQRKSHGEMMAAWKQSNSDNELGEVGHCKRPSGYKDFSVDDILAETASLVKIPRKIHSSELDFGGYIPGRGGIDLSRPNDERDFFCATRDSLVADSDEVTELRVQAVALTARVKKLEEELTVARESASASAVTHEQYQNLATILRARNSDLEQQVTDLSAKLAQQSGSVGKLNDLILRQDAALKHLRSAASRKIKLAKRRVTMPSQYAFVYSTMGLASSGSIFSCEF